MRDRAAPLQRHLHRDGAAHRVTEHRDGTDAELLEQRPTIGREALDAVPTLATAAATVAAEIRRDDLEVRGELGDLVFPVAAARAEAVEQQQRRPGARG